MVGYPNQPTDTSRLQQILNWAFTSLAPAQSSPPSGPQGLAADSGASTTPPAWAKPSVDALGNQINNLAGAMTSPAGIATAAFPPLGIAAAPYFGYQGIVDGMHNARLAVRHAVEGNYGELGADAVNLGGDALMVKGAGHAAKGFVPGMLGVLEDRYGPKPFWKEEPKSPADYQQPEGGLFGMAYNPNAEAEQLQMFRGEGVPGDWLFHRHPKDYNSMLRDPVSGLVFGAADDRGAREAAQSSAEGLSTFRLTKKPKLYGDEFERDKAFLQQAVADGKINPERAKSLSLRSDPERAMNGNKMDPVGLRWIVAEGAKGLHAAMKEAGYHGFVIDDEAGDWIPQHGQRGRGSIALFPEAIRHLTEIKTEPGVVLNDFPVEQFQQDPMLATTKFGLPQTSSFLKNSALLHGTHWRFPTPEEIGNEYNWEYKRHWDGKLDPGEFAQVVKQGKVVNVTDDLHRQIGNSTMSDDAGLRSLVSNYQFPRDVDRIHQGFAEEPNNQIPLPIVVQDKGGYRIMSGNTRLNTALNDGVPRRALVINGEYLKKHYGSSSADYSDNVLQIPDTASDKWSDGSLKPSTAKPPKNWKPLANDYEKVTTSDHFNDLNPPPNPHVDSAMYTPPPVEQEKPVNYAGISAPVKQGIEQSPNLVSGADKKMWVNYFLKFGHEAGKFHQHMLDNPDSNLADWVAKTTKEAQQSYGKTGY